MLQIYNISIVNNYIAWTMLNYNTYTYKTIFWFTDWIICGQETIKNTYYFGYFLFNRQHLICSRHVLG